MIAKLPGDKRLFMGDNLEMVCLFQAAEIERLIDNLDEYKLKYVFLAYLGTRKSKGRNSTGTPTKSRSRSLLNKSSRPTAPRARTKSSRTSSASRPLSLKTGRKGCPTLTSTCRGNTKTPSDKSTRCCRTTLASRMRTTA